MIDGPVDPRPFSGEQGKASTSRMEWKFPPSDVEAKFVFMSVDVIKHTELLANVIDKPDFEFAAFDAMLQQLPDTIAKCIAHYDEKLRWDWAGDGGIYAFPIGWVGFDIYEFVIQCAEAILVALPEFNSTWNPEGARAIKLRIAADTGKALFRAEPSFRRSLALNIAAKLKVADDESSIAITSNFYRQLRPQSHTRALFIPVPRLGTEPSATTTYVHAEFSKKSLGEKVGRHVDGGQMMFAAHCEYRRFAIDFGRGELTLALDSIGRAIEYVQKEEPGRYYSATLCRFYEGWFSIVKAMSNGRLKHTADRWDRILFLSGPAVETFLKTTEKPLTVMLMPAVEYMLEQLDILARYVDAPRSLSVLEILGILLRAGFSPLLKQEAASLAIDRVIRELETHNWSVDDECSLCTGRALSALALARREQSVAAHVKAWFVTLRSERFCVLVGNYTGVLRDHHAMHYAASVAQSLMDWRGDDDLLAEVIAAFFPAEITHPEELLNYWFKWRSESSFLVGAYIFAMFQWMKQHPTFRRLVVPHSALVQAACDLYVSFLKEEAASAHVEQESYLYAYRENLAALILSADHGESSEPVRGVVNLFRKKISRVVERDEHEKTLGDDWQPRRRYPLSSSIDRTVRFMESWFRYFEARLASGEPIDHIDVDDVDGA